MKMPTMPIIKLKSENVTKRILELNKDKFWIFGNFSLLEENCIIYAAKNLNYTIRAIVEEKNTIPRMPMLI